MFVLMTLNFLHKAVTQKIRFLIKRTMAEIQFREFYRGGEKRGRTSVEERSREKQNMSK